MNWGKIGKALLFPHIAVIIILMPIATATLILAMIYLEESSWLRYVAYMLAFYTLVILCARIPRMVAFFKKVKNNNKIVKRWTTDTRLRMKITLIVTVVINCAYASLQLGLGIYHRAAWFYCLAVYYYLLAGMRLVLARHTVKYQAGEKMKEELTWYRACGWVFLLMNLALSGMMLFLVRGERFIKHNEITTIAMATYTFASFAMAITNVVKYRKFNSPVFSASKAISLAAACVSVMTLENTMLATFSNGEMTFETQKLFLALTGGVIAIFIVIMAIYMVVRANQKIKALKEENIE